MTAPSFRQRDLDRLRAMLDSLEATEARMQRRFGDRAKGSRRASEWLDAEALRRALPVLEQLRASPPALPDGKPAFVVAVEAGGRGGEASLLRWAVAPNHAGRKKLQGQRFACYPVHDGGELVEPEAPPAAPQVPWPFPQSFHKDTP